MVTPKVRRLVHPEKSDVLVGLTDNQLTGSSGRFPQLSTNQDFGIKVAAPIGNLLGQVLFGWLADVVGRKRMCMVWFIFCALRGSNLATIRRDRTNHHHHGHARPGACWVWSLRKYHRRYRLL